MSFVNEKKDGKDEWITGVTNPMSSMVIDGDWFLVEIPFKPKHADSKLEIFIKGRDDSKELIYVDDVMIYETGINYYKKGENTLIHNNYFIPLKACK